MAEFKMKIAGKTAQITTLYESTRDYCRGYRTEDLPDFSITVTRADLTFEQEQYDEEARQEGFRFRKFTDPFLERAAIQRKFAEYLLDHGTLMFHGSAIAVDGDGYLFTARSGTGKSTHTQLWRERFGNRAVMVNDDKPFLQITEKEIFLCGSPWSGKHGLDTNITVPLKGICILHRGPENRIEQISPADALPRLIHESYCPLDPAKYPRFLELIQSLSMHTPLFRMECTRDSQAAEVAHNAMKPRRPAF